jgi:hypothetical protein
MWFELHLDEETSLSTSPYLEKGPTWQQVKTWIVAVVCRDAMPSEQLCCT